MNFRVLGLASLLVLMLVAVGSAAANSAGQWSGHFTGRRADVGVSFSVTASGRKLVVSNFLSSGAIKAPCARTAPTAVGGIPAATVTPRRSFKSVGSEDSGFGRETWTVTGRFKGTHAASGTVAIVLMPAPDKPCRFTIRWKAAVQAAAAPRPGATYVGKMHSRGGPVTLHVSADGKSISSISWEQPLIGGNCPGLSDEVVTFTAHDVVIHNSSFTYTQHVGKITNGQGQTGTNTISGQFLSGGQVAGQISTSSDIASIGKACVGSDTWTAHS
jgi:hypothetical protein